MLTLVLFLLFVHNSAVPMMLQPLKSLTNNKKMIMNKSLVEELVDADPAQVQQLLDLIETMLLDARTNLENLELGCTNANNGYDTAVDTYEAALLSHTGNQEIFDVALEAKNAALEAKVFANGAKVEAQKNLDDSKPILDSEIETLEQMIHLNGQLSSPNQGMTDMLQGMLESAQTILGGLELECTKTINDYNDAVIAYDAAVIAYDAAEEKLRISLEALNVAQEARDVAQGVKTEAQYVLDIGKPSLEVEISNLEEMLSIHGRLNPIKTWKVIIPATKLTGPAINHNVPIPVTHTLHLGNDVWLVGAIDGPYLKIVKIRVTGETASLWMGTRYNNKPSSSCKSEITFSEACFEAGTTNPKKDMYPVSLVAIYDSYVPYPGWRSDSFGYSTQTTPCDVQSFVANLPNGYGYYSDPGVSGGWCRTIAPENIETIRSAYGSSSWTQHSTGVTYLTPDRYTILNNMSCGWAGECGDDNQLFIGANGERWTSTDSSNSGCRVVCDQSAECGGFNYVRSHDKCYYRKLATCSQVYTSDRVCYIKNAEYVEGILNSNSCPGGYEHIITEADCRVAASTCLSLNTVDCSFWKFNKKGSWGHNPKGCFYDGGNNGGSNVFFNTHVTGGVNQVKDRPICKRSN